MHKNTRDLRLYLLGHPWDEATAQFDEAGEYTTWNESPCKTKDDLSLMSKTLEKWQDAELRRHLNELFGDSRDFEALENAVLEARKEPADEVYYIPHRDYICVDTLSKLVLHLPIADGLTSFTVDTCGTELLGTDHICNMIADVLPHIHNVRIRMARMCPGKMKASSTGAWLT